MNITPEESEELKILIGKDLDLAESTALTKVNAYDELKEYLVQEIKILLSSNFQQLLNVLYRIDVSETKAGQAIALKEPSAIADKLAELILERQYQKAKTRIAYRNRSND